MGPQTFAEGSVVAGTYELGPRLGSGGYGTVFRAHQLRTGGVVALKLLTSRDPDAVQRFLREARLAMRLTQPAVVRVLDAGMADDGQAYVAYELLEGAPLDRWIAMGPCGEAQALAVVRPLLGALAQAHAAGVIHRDVKPANVFVCSTSRSSRIDEGSIKLLDFGVAKTSLSQTVSTVPGALMGTPLYMAPEQLEGGPVTPATDLYAVGLVLAELLAGRPVFEPVLATLVAAKTSDAPVPLEPLVTASRFGPVVARAVRRRASERFQTAQEMLEALGAVGAPSATDDDRPTAFAPAPSSPPAAPVAAAPVNPHAPTAFGPVHPTAPNAVALARAAPPRRRWVWLLALVVVGVPALAAGLWLRTKPHAGAQEGDDLGVETAPPGRRVIHVPAPAHPGAGVATRCPAVDGLGWRRFRAKLPAWASREPRSVTREPGRQSVLLADPPAGFYFYDLGELPRVDKVARMGTSAGFEALTGDKRLVLVDAPVATRDAVRRAICE